jgi:uncharacterized protein (UPF0548 family)
VNVELLSEADRARWHDAPFTYAEVGATADALPPGFRHLRRRRTLDPAADFRMAARAVMTWQLQTRAGLQVRASSREVEPDAVVVLRLGLLLLSAPCRVVYVIDEADRQGFAYGTLPGHPESGEESFVVERRPDGRVDFTVTAFSRPATTLAHLGGPVARWVQSRVTTRYLRALETL